MKPNLFSRKRQRGAASTWIFVGFAAIALFFLLTEHRAHLYGWLPFLLLAACPLMHLFHGHRGHAGHGTGGEPRPLDAAAPVGAAPNRDAPASPVAQHHH